MSQKVKNDENGSDIDENGQNEWKMKKIIIFGFFSEKYETMSKKVRNDENGSDIDENGQNWWKMKKIIFFGFFQKNIKNVEKSEKWWKWVRYWWKRSKLMKTEKQ